MLDDFLLFPALSGAVGPGEGAASSVSLPPRSSASLNVSSSDSFLFFNDLHCNTNSHQSHSPAPSPVVPKIEPCIASSSKSDPPLSPSQLRDPTVRAKDRLKVWTSPYAIQQANQAREKYGSKFIDKVLSAGDSALADSSKTSYSAGVKQYIDFCTLWSIPEELRVPADEWVLAGFIQFLSDAGYSSSTVKTYLSGVHAWHTEMGAPWHANHPRVAKARAAATKTCSSRKLPPRSPVSSEHLTILRRTLDLSKGRDAAIYAAATSAFFGCRRLGEIVITAKFDPFYHVTKESARIDFREKNGTVSATFRLPWTKTTKREGGTVSLTARPDDLCPIFAIRNHLSINEKVPASFPLFSYIEDGTPRHLTKKSLISSLISIWKPYNLAEVKGHSFRIGGAVELMMSGVPPHVVAVTGGWKGLAFLTYWRRAEEIIPLFTSQAYSKQDWDRTKRAMNDFASKNSLHLPITDSLITP